MTDSTFLFLYRLPEDHQNDDADVAAWNEWLAGLGDDLSEVGLPIATAVVAGPASAEQRLTGYSTIRAAHLAVALEIARRCPAVAVGGSVEVGQLVAMPEGHGPTSA
jgi:hypothetical protein